MARDFGVTNPEYLKALEEIRSVSPRPEYWQELKILLEEEDKRAAETMKRIRGDPREEYYFTI